MNMPCKCGARQWHECPGEWEPGCDLGANEAHAAVVDDTALEAVLRRDPAVTIGRLRKRVAKLTQQRDHYKAKCERYAQVLDTARHLERGFETMQQHRAERERVKGLEARVREQAELIKRLTGAA